MSSNKNEMSIIYVLQNCIYLKQIKYPYRKIDGNKADYTLKLK